MTREEIIEFLEQDEIKLLIEDENLEEVYSKCDYHDRKDLTEYLLSIGIHPDEYMRNIPSAFLRASQISSYDISSTVSAIGGYAFYDCKSLASIIIPNSVKSIGDYSFNNCKALTSITIGDSVESIGDSAFEWCTSLQSVTIPCSVTTIDYSAFNYCTSLESIVIPDSVTKIGATAFKDCTGLTHVTLPKSVINIGAYAFTYCGDIEIYYNGTKEQWKANVRAEAFKYTSYIAHCIDGDIAKRRK